MSTLDEYFHVLYPIFMIAALTIIYFQNFAIGCKIPPMLTSLMVFWDFSEPSNADILVWRYGCSLMPFTRAYTHLLAHFAIHTDSIPAVHLCPSNSSQVTHHKMGPVFDDLTIVHRGLGGLARLQTSCNLSWSTAISLTVFLFVFPLSLQEPQGRDHRAGRWPSSSTCLFLLKKAFLLLCW